MKIILFFELFIGKIVPFNISSLEEIERHGQLVIAGDGRHDSMGHSAKYCAYTVFCCTVPLIIHFALVQVQYILSV